MNKVKTKQPVQNTSLSIGLALLFFLIFFIIVYWVPVKKVETPPFLIKENNRPLVIAHQGGKHLAPGNTIPAFQKAVDLGVDVIETDIHITKDGYLVTIHDPTIDASTDGKGSVEDYTLKELQQMDAAFHFQDLKGEYSYRGKGVYIPTLEEVFQRFPHTKVNIEIKDDNPSSRMDEISQKLMLLIEEYDMEDKVLVASFDQKIIRTFQKYSKGIVATQGGRQEAKKFVILHKLFLRNLYKPNADAFQIPLQEGRVDLTHKDIINGAHRRGLHVHYWTVNDKSTMKRLLDAGADGIITDRPDLLIEVIEAR
ncbi:glycerophosphodiester phosphodiesterase [Rossellomorea aquimaris]|uniref:glycerophosphodiester phosphodiesterase n=1 Tax=Rossellomorea aquimaris TaxID=189382 RepID=UPI0007D0A9E8|nr:glycerophosphodiester phosphodiesterase [Rossellomorea aquimaris]